MGAGSSRPPSLERVVLSRSPDTHPQVRAADWLIEAGWLMIATTDPTAATRQRRGS
jgi:hypothetical protein